MSAKPPIVKKRGGLSNMFSKLGMGGSSSQAVSTPADQFDVDDFDHTNVGFDQNNLTSNPGAYMT